MKQVVEAYVGLWIIVFMLMLALAFTSINMHVSQARKLANDIKVEVQASNGTLIPDGENQSKTWESDAKLENEGYQFDYTITRQVLNSSGSDPGETYIYNDIYKIQLNYEYIVPLFGRQIYPIVMFAY